MAKCVYEVMIILDPNRYARDPLGVSNQVNDTFTKHGGELLVTRLWEERRLAYPIDGQRKGVYWLVYVRLDSLKLSEVEHEFKINETILRHLALKIDPRIVEMLVAHAKAGPTSADPNKSKKPETPQVPDIESLEEAAQV